MLATGFFLLRAWVSERVSMLPRDYRPRVGAFATILIMAAGIGYRVLEVPLPAGSEDDIAFVASLPNIEKNNGGREAQGIF